MQTCNVLINTILHINQSLMSDVMWRNATRCGATWHDIYCIVI